MAKGGKEKAGFHYDILGVVPDSDLEVEVGAAQATRPDSWGGTSSV